MKPNDFSYYLHKFLVIYLPNEKAASINTLDTYRYTFILYLEFQKTKNILAEKITIKDFTRQSVIEFLNWLENDRNSSISTRNNRLACIFSFCRFLQYEYPDYLNNYNDILNIPMKKADKKIVSYIDIDGIKILLEQPNINTKKGYRDYMILLILYESAIRVSELIMLKVGDFNLKKPYYLKVLGKGKKERLIPLHERIALKVKEYFNFINIVNKPEHLVFFNSRKESFTRMGITYILQGYVKIARETTEYNFPDITPHILRHSKAMNLLQHDVNLIYIRDMLGHTSIQTTEIYARADSKRKREAIENAYENIITSEEPEWKDKNVLDWLKQFK